MDFKNNCWDYRIDKTQIRNEMSLLSQPMWKRFKEFNSDSLLLTIILFIIRMSSFPELRARGFLIMIGHPASSDDDVTLPGVIGAHSDTSWHLRPLQHPHIRTHCPGIQNSDQTWESGREGRKLSSIKWSPINKKYSTALLKYILSGAFWFWETFISIDNWDRGFETSLSLLLLFNSRQTPVIWHSHASHLSTSLTLAQSIRGQLWY